MAKNCFRSRRLLSEGSLVRIPL